VYFNVRNYVFIKCYQISNNNSIVPRESEVNWKSWLRNCPNSMVIWFRSGITITRLVWTVALTWRALGSSPPSTLNNLGADRPLRTGSASHHIKVVSIAKHCIVTILTKTLKAFKNHIFSFSPWAIMSKSFLKGAIHKQSRNQIPVGVLLESFTLQFIMSYSW